MTNSISIGYRHKDVMKFVRRELTGDGEKFSDLSGMETRHVDLIVDRGLAFVTEFKKDNAIYGGVIVAASFESAEKIASERGFGEVVLGQICMIVDL